MTRAQQERARRARRAAREKRAARQRILWLYRRVGEAVPVRAAVRVYEQLRREARKIGRRWQQATSRRERQRAGRAYHLALARRDRAKRAILAAAIRAFGRS